MTVQPRAVLLGAGISLAIAVPFALIAGLVIDSSSSGGLVALFFVAIAGALVTGGFVAGAKTPDAPLSNGAVAALAAFVAGQLVTIVVELARGDGVGSIVAIAFNAMLATAIGTLGGSMAARRSGPVTGNSLR